MTDTPTPDDHARPGSSGAAGSSTPRTDADAPTTEFRATTVRESNQSTGPSAPEEPKSATAGPDPAVDGAPTEQASPVSAAEQARAAAEEETRASLAERVRAALAEDEAHSRHDRPEDAEATVVTPAPAPEAARAPEAGPASVREPRPAAPPEHGPAGAATVAHGGGEAPPWWRRRPALIAAGVVGGLALLYGAAYAVTGNDLARNATVLGVEVGGMSAAEAEATLADELPALVDQPIEVEVPEAESTFPIVPSEAGMGIDYAATVQTIPGGSANPVSLVRALFGGGEVAPVPAVHRDELETALADVAEESDEDPVNGGIAFEDGDVVVSEAEVGHGIDVAATADLLEAEFFGADSGPHELPLGTVTAAVELVEPEVTDDDVQRALTEFAEPAMSGPVTVVAGDHTLEIEPEIISEALTMSADDEGALVPRIDADDLAEAAGDVLDEAGDSGQNATVRIENGAPQVIPSRAGYGIAPGSLADALLPALAETGEGRTVTVELDEVEPELTTADAEALGVEDVIGESTTSFPHAGYRNTNIGLAAEKIHNTLLLPGETFSLNETVGERTGANGFAVGWTIDGGRLREAHGGGVSQVATTTYNAAFVAGLEDVYHQPHSIYFDRYPVGAEATVSWGNFDMSFRNDTPYGVLVEARFTPSSPGSQGSLNVRLWSTKHFEVETWVSDRTNHTSPPTIYDSSSECEAQTGWNGFSITSYRQVWTPDGDMVKDESYPWTYRPNPTVVCGSEPDDDDDD